MPAAHSASLSPLRSLPPPPPPESTLEAELRTLVGHALDRAPSPLQRRVLKANLAYWLIGA